MNLQKTVGLAIDTEEIVKLLRDQGRETAEYEIDERVLTVLLERAEAIIRLAYRPLE